VSDTIVSKRTYEYPRASKPDNTGQERWRAVHTGDEGMQYTVRESFQVDGTWFTTFTTYEV
jgi:hypothetical protein